MGKGKRKVKMEQKKTGWRVEVSFQGEVITRQFPSSASAIRFVEKVPPVFDGVEIDWIEVYNNEWIYE